MAVKISDIAPDSPAERAGIRAGDELVSINKNEIMDVLDFRFHQQQKKLKLVLLRDSKKRKVKIKKDEFDELGLQFETYLMDEQHSCRNKCIFCFIDQMPKGLRDSLYFKDDDSRLSFLFGNYITLTNLSEHEISRIIKMHISPVNISVHTTNPDLRCKMMNNRFAGEVLDILKRFDQAGIAMNCQLVLCPRINDGKELEKSLRDLCEMENVSSVACVPVGLTRFREGLYPLDSYCEKTAAETIDIIEAQAGENLKTRGERVCYPSDEFFLTARRPLPQEEYYGDFLQLENGVGMLTLFECEAEAELDSSPEVIPDREVMIVTGHAAADTLRSVVDKAQKKWHNLKCEVFPVINNFFGEKITVAGLVTATDIIAQLKNRPHPSEILIPSAMLRAGEQTFLDDLTVSDLERELGVRVKITSDGGSLINALSADPNKSVKDVHNKN